MAAHAIGAAINVLGAIVLDTKIIVSGVVAWVAGALIWQFILAPQLTSNGS